MAARLTGRTLDFGSGRWRFESSAASVKCFKCTKELESAFGDLPDAYRTPSKGLVFSGPGNYGSQIYDPVTSAPALVVWICDDCIVEHKDLVQTVQYAFVKTEAIWRDFDPESDDYW